MNKKEYRRAYYLENRQKEIDLNKQWKLANSDKVKKINLKHQLKAKYNISTEDYIELLTKQNNCCSICKRSSENFSSRFSVDHCHKTGKVRGLLCRACNAGIGHFKDDPKICVDAAQYLSYHQGEVK